MTTLEALRAGRAVIANPDHWTRGAMFAAANGDTLPTPAGAQRFCSIGALMVVTWEELLLSTDDVLGDASRRALNRAAPKPYGNAITANDHGGHRIALAMYDAAIRNEEARVQEWDVPAPAAELMRELIAV